MNIGALLLISAICLITLVESSEKPLKKKRDHNKKEAPKKKKIPSTNYSVTSKLTPLDDTPKPTPLTDTTNLQPANKTRKNDPVAMEKLDEIKNQKVEKIAPNNYQQPKSANQVIMGLAKTGDQLSFMQRVARRMGGERPPSTPRDWPVLFDEDQYKLELKFSRRLALPTGQPRVWEGNSLHKVSRACQVVRDYVNATHPLDKEKILTKKIMFRTRGPYIEDGSKLLHANGYQIMPPNRWERNEIKDVPVVMCKMAALGIPLYLTGSPDGRHLYVFADDFKNPDILMLKDFVVYHEFVEEDGTIEHVIDTKRPKHWPIHIY